MIRRTWLEIVALLLLTSMPLIAIQSTLVQQSVDSVFVIIESMQITEFTQNLQDRLRKLANVHPESEAELKDLFSRSLEINQNFGQINALAEPISANLVSQSRLIALIVIVVSFLISYPVSRSLIGRVEKLTAERRKAAERISALQSLEQWQHSLRQLVHEMRAPITPIKLVSSNLVKQYQTLPPETFKEVLSKSQGLMSEQVASIETMIESFARFGRMPSAVMARANIGDVIKDFLDRFSQSFGNGVIVRASENEVSSEVLCDAKLIHDLFFNLCRNAADVNAGSAEVTISSVLKDKRVIVTVTNTGKIIPQDVVQKIFVPQFSSNASSSNMGLGLAIARKIALEHGGDLELSLNENERVGFSFSVATVSFEEKA